MKFKESWQNCIDAVVKSMVEGKIVSEAPCVSPFTNTFEDNVWKLQCHTEIDM